MASQLIAKDAVLDLHRWHFVNGGLRYTTAIPLLSSNKMQALSREHNTFRFMYVKSGVDINVSLDDNQLSSDSECQTVENKTSTKFSKKRKNNDKTNSVSQAKNPRRFWRPLHNGILM